MHKQYASDIFCLSAPSTPDEQPGEEILYTIKGVTCARLCRRQQETQNSDVFPAGCMGNKVGEDPETVNAYTKRHARLSYDEQERAMNILTKLHEARKAQQLQARLSEHRRANGGDVPIAGADEDRARFRLTVRKSAPQLADLEYMLELIKQLDEPSTSSSEAEGEEAGNHNDEGGGGGSNVIAGERRSVESSGTTSIKSPSKLPLVTTSEVRYFQTIMMKERAMPFFMSRFRNNLVPSLIERNPITGVGLDFGARRGR